MARMVSAAKKEYRTISYKARFGVLVSDAKSCQHKENVFVVVKSQRQKAK